MAGRGKKVVVVATRARMVEEDRCKARLHAAGWSARLREETSSESRISLSR